MSNKPLFKTNPYLKTGKYQESLLTNVSSSAAIETGSSSKSIAKKLSESNIHKELFSTKKRKVSSR